MLARHQNDTNPNPTHTQEHPTNELRLRKFRAVVRSMTTRGWDGRFLLNGSLTSRWPSLVFWLILSLLIDL